MMPLAEAGNLLGQTFGKYGFLGYVSPDSELRDVARAQEEVLNKYGVDLGFREDIYEAVKAYSQTKGAKKLEGERARYLEFTMRDYRRNGFDESAEAREKLQELQNRMVELGLEFEKNLAEWKDGIEVPADSSARSSRSRPGTRATRETSSCSRRRSRSATRWRGSSATSRGPTIASRPGWPRTRTPRSTS
jgi:Zn-dependent oligopeptidase